MKTEQLKKDELERILKAREKAAAAAAQLEKFAAEARIAELEFRVAVQEVFLANGLRADCQVDQATGAVTWPAEEIAGPVVETVEQKG